MSVIEWLERVKKFDAVIDCKIAERDQLREMLVKIIPELSGMPRDGSVSDPVGDGVAKLLDLEKEIDRCIDEYVDLKKEVIAVLERLPAKEYEVLHRRYIRYESYEEIARWMNYSVMQIWRIKQSAITLLKVIL